MSQRSVRPRSRTRRQFIPPQHGAWAMLLVPYLAALSITGIRWPHLPLLGAWLAGYLLSYYVLQAVKTRRPRRVRAQLLLYAIATVALGGIVVVARPEVLRFAPLYGLLIAVNVGYAWRRRERALANDIASVVQSCLMVFVVAAVAGVPAHQVTVAFVAVLGYFVGVVLYVKTVIRERGNRAYLRGSIVYHVAALGGAALLGVPLAVVFAILLVRAWILPARRPTPKTAGLLEMIMCVLLLVAIVVNFSL